MTERDLCVWVQISSEDNVQAFVFPRAAAAGCTAPSTVPTTGLETTMEHHVSLGKGRQAAKLMNIECFPIRPKLKQGACFS